MTQTQNIPELKGKAGYFAFKNISASGDVYRVESPNSKIIRFFFWDGTALFPLILMPDNKYYVDADKTITDPEQQEAVLVYQKDFTVPTVDNKPILTGKAPANAVNKTMKGLVYRIDRYLDNPYVHVRSGFDVSLANEITDKDLLSIISLVLQSSAFFSFDTEKVTPQKAADNFIPLGTDPVPKYKNEYQDPANANNTGTGTNNNTTPASGNSSNSGTNTGSGNNSNSGTNTGSDNSSNSGTNTGSGNNSNSGTNTGSGSTTGGGTAPAAETRTTTTDKSKKGTN